MTRTSKHGLWSHRFRIERDFDEVLVMIGYEPEIAAFNDIDLARHSFDFACSLYPDARLKLLHGSRVMIEHPAPEPSERAKK